jgi:predicted dienelactone hydrolase
MTLWRTFAALGRLCACSLALLMATAVGGAGAADAAATPFKAGETARTTTSASAGLRNRGNEALRMLVWYPAPTATTEAPAQIGSPDQAVFIAGQVAREAAWADARRHPVVLLSHGFGGTAMQMTWLGSALARSGYVTIAVDHPGTNGIDGITPQGAYAPWERAGDLVAALDAALADPTLAPHLDAKRVGVAGFSMGGFTGALLAGARTDFAHFAAFCGGPSRDAICNEQKEFPLDYRLAPKTLGAAAMAPVAAREHADWRDPRIVAAFLVAPALGEALEARSLAQVKIPVAVLYGDRDAIAPPATNGQLIAAAVPGARQVALAAVGHYDFLSECGALGLKVAADYCSDGQGPPRAQTHVATIAQARRFFDEWLAPR